ncbi:carboxypeptidase regulatory-like domain-containing protein [Massilia sp. W12]|uniref:carboxypeptidase regulatory-like domain-containing protein n=1 Tax=Massilia sp. W12 TaxID=3126507 RepID=UPI0030D33F06
MHTRISLPQLFSLAALACIGPAAHSATMLGTVLDKTGNPVMDAVIYAMPADNAPLPKPVEGAPLVVTQEYYTFNPYVSVLRTGGAVRFANRDPHEHHIKSFSPAKSFELRIAGKKDDSAPVLFEKSGDVALVCHFHDWMRGFVLVLDTPWFGKTDKSGNVVINNLPPGKYDIRAWAPKMIGEPPMQSLQVAANDPAAVKFQLNFIPAPAPKPVFSRKRNDY